MTITMMLDTTIEHNTFASVIQGLVMKGLMFDVQITGTKAIIVLTGGF